MQVDKKPKLNILQKLNDLDVNSDFKGHFIHDGYCEMYRILFQDIQKIKQYLSNIDAIAQNIINSIFQNNIQNVQSMKSIALNIEKELEYYVDPKDIHDMYEHKASETKVTEAVKDIINTINMILETEVNMENIQHIRTAVEGINNAFTDQEERIKNDALEIIGKLIQKVTSERETPNDIENNIITLFEEFIKNRFEHINHTFFKKQIRDQKTERFLRRLFGGHFDLIKNGFTEDNTNKLTSLLESMTVSRTDKIIEKLREFAYDDTEYKDNKVTKAFSEEVSASNINTLVDKLTSEILSKSPEEIREDVYSDKIKESLTYIFEVIDPRFWTKITDDDILYIADEISSKINRMCNENKKSNDTIPIRLLKTHFKEKCIEAFGSKLENEGISSEHIFMISRRAEYALENVLKNVATEVTMPILSTTTLTVEIEFKDHTETLGIYEYIVLPIANTAIKTINDIKKRHESSAKKIDEKVDIAIIENAEENITTQLLKLLEINKIIEENANVVIVEQIITPIARAIILTDIDVYVKEVVKTNAQEIMELIRTLVSKMILNNYFQFVLYDCQKEYAILREACELLLTNTSDEHRELFNKIKHLDSIKGNIIFSINAEFAIYRVQYIVIMMFKKFTEENTDIYDIILTMCENFTDVFNRNYFIFLIEKTKILEEVIKDSELKCITIYYMLYYAYRKISPDNTLALYVLNFEMHKLRFLYDMNEFLLRIDPVMYSRVYNMLFAYYHFQNNSAKLTNNIYDLNNNDKKVIHAIMYIINRMKYPILIPTIRAHNDIYASLNNVFSVCDDAVDNNVMDIDNDFYIFNNSFNSSLSRIATYTCYYVIFIEVYDIFTDDTRVTFLERINNINIINTHTSLNEYENIETRIQERLLRYKLLRMIDVDLLSKLLNKVNDTIQHFVQNEYITKLINNILAFVEDNVTRIPDDIVEVELNIDEYVVDVIKDIVSYLRTIPIYKYIQKATSISPSVRHIIDLFNIIYESVLTSDHITYDIINEFIQTLDYFNIGKEVNIDFLPYNPNLVLKYLSNIMDSPEYRILIIYFNNTQSIIDNITTNRTEVDSIMEEISTNFHDKVLHALRVPFDYNTDYNVLREMFGITKRIKDEIDIEDIYTESYLTTMRNIFRVDLFNKDHDELHNDMKGGNIVYDTTYFIKNELPDTRRNDDLYGGMYTPAHMMLPLDIKFNTCKLRILAKVTPKITSALKKACYVDELEGVQADIPEDAQEYVLKDVLRSTLKDVPRSTLKDVLECVPEDVLRSTLKDVLEGVQADIPEDAQEYVPKDVLRSTLKDVLEGVPEDVLESVLESVLEGVPEDVPNVVLEGVPKVVLESVLEGVLNGTLVGVPEDVPEDVPEGTSSVLSVVNKTEYFNKAIRLFYPLIDMITYYIKCAMYIGFKQEFTDIEKLPLLYKYMYEYFQTAIRCAICQKDINTTVYILPLSNYNPSKVMFYDDFDHLPYVDILRPIFDKLNATNRHEIYTRLLYDVTKAECYTIFNERIAVPFFAALVYHATVIHYLNLPITILRKILNLDEKTNNVQIALIHEYLSPVF